MLRPVALSSLSTGDASQAPQHRAAQHSLIQLIQKVILDSFETQLRYFIFCRAPRLYLAEASSPPSPALPQLLILHSANLTSSHFLHLCSYPPPLVPFPSPPYPSLLHLLAISYREARAKLRVFFALGHRFYYCVTFSLFFSNHFTLLASFLVFPPCWYLLSRIRNLRWV